MPDPSNPAAAPNIRREQRGPLALIWLDRPAALNAMTIEMMRSFNAAIAAAEADPATYVIAVCGEGRGFCAGFDAGDLGQAVGASNRRLDERGIDPEMPAQFAQLLMLSKPVIAAVNGAAAGLGLILALMCDLRFVAEEAVFVTAFSHRGVTAEHGVTWLLPRLVGHSRALDLLWSSRKVDGQEAYRIGLADRVMPRDALLPAVEAYAADLADKASPNSMALIKQMVYRHLDAPMKSAMVEADKLATASLAHPDAQEGVKAFVERRKPQFAPPAGSRS